MKATAQRDREGDAPRGVATANFTARPSCYPCNGWVGRLDSRARYISFSLHGAYDTTTVSLRAKLYNTAPSNKETIMLSILFILTMANLQAPQAVLPVAAVKILNDSIPDWTFQAYSEEEKEEGWGSYFKCVLNDDTVPDYALNVVVKEDSTSYFIALLSDGNGFKLYYLWDEREYKGEYFSYMRVYTAGTEITNFGFRDEPDTLADIPFQSVFKTDCIEVGAKEQNGCVTYVFDNGKVRSFVSCD